MEQNSLGVITDRETSFGRLVGKILFISILIALFWSPLWFGSPQHNMLQKTLVEKSIDLKPDEHTFPSYVSFAYVALFQITYPNKYLEYGLFAIGALTVLALLSRCRVMSKNHSVTYVGLGWALLMMAVIASGKMSKVPADPWGGALYVLYGAFFYAAVVSFLTRGRRELAALVICLGMLFVAQNALFQFCGGLERTRSFFAQEQGYETLTAFTNAWFKTNHTPTEQFNINRLLSDRVYSNFTNPNILASYCMIVSLLGLGLYKSGIKSVVKIIGLLATVLALATLFLTRSKSVIMITFALFVLWSFILYRAKALSLNFLIGVFILGAVFATVNMVWGYGMGLKNKLVSSGGARLDYWKTALDMIRKRVLTGHGVDSFARNYTGSEGTLFAHNTLLHMWAEFGIFAGIGWLLASYLPIVNGWDNFKAAAKKDALQLSCILASGGFFVHNLLDFDFHVPGLTLVALAVMAMAFQNYNENEATQN